MTNEIPTSTEVKPVTNDEKTWATIVHLSALAGYILPIFTVIAPLIIWLVKRNEMPFVDDQGKEALNFQITMLFAFIVSFLLMFILIGFFLLVIVGVTDLILIIVAAVHANRGEYYRYPFTLRIIK